MARYLACKGYSTFREWHQQVLKTPYAPIDVRCFARHSRLCVGRVCACTREQMCGWVYVAGGAVGARCLLRWHAHDDTTMIWCRGESSVLFVPYPNALHASRCCYGLFFDMYTHLPTSLLRNTWLFDPDIPVLGRLPADTKGRILRVVSENGHVWFDTQDSVLTQKKRIHQAYDKWRRRGGVMHTHRCHAAWLYANVSRYNRPLRTLLRRWKKRRTDAQHLHTISPRHELRGLSHTEISARLIGHPSRGMSSVLLA